MRSVRPLAAADKRKDDDNRDGDALKGQRRGDAYRSVARPLLVILELCKLGPPLPETVINISESRVHEWRALH